MPKRVWAGAPLLDTISGQAVNLNIIPSMKKKKGKKKDAAPVPALERIMGYTGSDLSEEEVSDRLSLLSATEGLKLSEQPLHAAT